MHSLSKYKNRPIEPPKVSCLLIKALDSVAILNRKQLNEENLEQVSSLNSPEHSEEEFLISFEEFMLACEKFKTDVDIKGSPISFPRLCHGSQFGLFSYLLSTASFFKDVINLFGNSAGALGFMPFEHRTIASLDSVAISVRLTAKHDISKRFVESYFIGIWCRLLEFCFEPYSKRTYIKVTVPEYYLDDLLKSFPHGFTFSASDTDKVMISTFPDNQYARLPGSNSRLHALFKKEVEVFINQVEEPENVASKIHRYLTGLTSFKGVASNSVADMLSMGERTMSRKLEKEGTSFKQLFKSAKSTRAVLMLMEGRAIEDIALMLGFSDRSSFERAFKNWQGLTPAFVQSKYAALASKKNIKHFIDPKYIPALPEIAMQLLRALQDDSNPIDDIADIVVKDAALAAKVLWVANSSLYGNRQIKTVKSAILNVFGTSHLKALVINLMATEVFPIDKQAFHFEKYWSASLISARLCESLLANEVDKDTLSNYYFASLLHNIGELFICYCMPSSYQRIYIETQTTGSWRRYNAVQSLRLNINTCEASALLATVWNLPENIKNSLSDFVTGDSKDPYFPVLNLIIELVHLCFLQGFGDEQKRANIHRFLLQVSKKLTNPLPDNIESTLVDIITLQERPRA